MLAKIESADSVGNLEDILDAVDGAMVARGDLGAELPVEEVCPLTHSTASSFFRPNEVNSDSKEDGVMAGLHVVMCCG